MTRRPGGLTILLVPDEGGETKTVRLPPKKLRLLSILGVLIVLAGTVMAGSWWFLALEATRGWELEALVDSLEKERLQITALVEELEGVEAGYEHLRSLFGTGADPVAPDLWLPPTGLPGSRSVGGGHGSEDHLPTTWPLTEAGFVTQALIEGGEEGDHPGLDIAVASDSYIRAAGAGKVLRTGDDPIYGLFVVMEHGNGYQTVYAHGSSVFVERGQEVRRGEVIALSGSTGSSTAPHLHFEVLLDGLPLDPLSMVEPIG